MVDRVGGVEYYVDVDTKGVLTAEKRVRNSLNNTEKDFEKLDRTTRKTSRSLFNFGNVASAVATILSGREVLRYADQYTLLNNRLKTVEKSTEGLVSAQNELFRLAQQTRSSLTSVTELYARLARNTKQLNLTQQETVAVSRAITQGFQISGASAQEAAASTIQLSQALASGVLRGDEFNSVAEQAPIILEAISKQTGRTRGELRDLASQGRITADLLVKALLNSAQDINKEFQELEGTTSQAFTQLNNSLITFIGNIDNATNATETISSAITELAAIMTALGQSAPDLIKGIELGFTPLRTLVALITGGIDGMNESIEKTQGLFEALTSGEAQERFTENLRKAREELGLIGDEATGPLEISITGGILQERSQIDEFFINFKKQLDSIKLAANEVGGSLGTAFGQTAINAVNQLSDGLGTAIVNGESLNDVFKNVARTVVSQFISSLVKVGLQYAINAALAQAAAATTTATGVAQATTLAAAYAPAAAAASIATGGAAAATGTATALGSIAAITSALAIGSGRLNGGPVQAGTIYPITEDGNPEILQNNTGSYLLPGKNGRVVSNKDMGQTGGNQVSINFTMNVDANTPEQFQQHLIQSAPTLVNLVEKGINDGGRRLGGR